MLIVSATCERMKKLHLYFKKINKFKFLTLIAVEEKQNNEEEATSHVYKQFTARA